MAHPNVHAPPTWLFSADYSNRRHGCSRGGLLRRDKIARRRDTLCCRRAWYSHHRGPVAAVREVRLIDYWAYLEGGTIISDSIQVMFVWHPSQMPLMSSLRLDESADWLMGHPTRYGSSLPGTRETSASFCAWMETTRGIVQWGVSARAPRPLAWIPSRKPGFPYLWHPYPRIRGVRIPRTSCR